MDTVKHYTKAIAGLVGPAVVALVVAWFVVTPHSITDHEWAYIITTALAGGGTVAAAPKNGPKPKRTTRRRTARGQYGLLYVLAVVVLILVIVWLVTGVR